MKKFLVTWIVSAATILLMSEVFSGFYVKDFKTAFLVALLLAILNSTLRPVLKILTFPMTIMTLGLWNLVVNGLMFLLVDYFMAPNFTINSIWLAILASIIIAITRSFVEVDD